jgi:hypothetical protein
MITEVVGYKMEVTENGILQICKITHLIKDGVEIAQQYHRTSLEPGQDTKTQPEMVQAVAGVVWDKKTIDAFAAAKEVSQKG